MSHPYAGLPGSAFWKRAVAEGMSYEGLPEPGVLVRAGEAVASAGSCFAANIVPYLERAGIRYVRTEPVPAPLAAVEDTNFSYAKFSARYGNIYTPRQAAQLLQRALGRFHPREDRWAVADGVIVDPFRPGLKYRACCDAEFDLLTAHHLERTLEAVRLADVFVFTLGLTEAWVSRADGAVFPACPGTIGGTFDAQAHAFHNFTVAEVTDDIRALIEVAREVRPGLRFILTVSPVPLVATATGRHVIPATIYSKSVLRVAAEQIARGMEGVTYFPAYEIVTGPQAPHGFFQADRREPSEDAIGAVMAAFLSRCEATEAGGRGPQPAEAASGRSEERSLEDLGTLIADAACEEAALDTA